MISVPIAANTKNHRHQLSLFWENHINIYGEDAQNKAHAIIVLQEPEIPNWDIGIPHTVVNSWQHCSKEPYDIHLAPLNIQIGLQQILHKFDDNAIIELIDCDMFHISKSKKYSPESMQFITNDIYENWHLRSLGGNKNIIKPYLKTENSYNGGFVPIIGRVSTFKTIIEEWIDIHIDIYNENSKNLLTCWWAGMYSFQAACANNGIKMISDDNCYIPMVNEISENHYIAHYCCDETYFNKKTALEGTVRIKTSEFPNNLFYERIKIYLLNNDLNL